MSILKIIVLDDDPTGSQTLHSCPLLLQWDLETLRRGLRDPAPILFILANTRALAERKAIARTQDVCRNLQAALALEGISDYLLVSRCDSTLRGHFSAEMEAIASVFGEFDGYIFAPAFFEGGRITRGGTHYVVQGEQLIPVADTEFARDAVFGFQDSFLPDFIAAKTTHKIKATQVDYLSPNRPTQELNHYFRQLRNGCYVVLDGEEQRDFDRLRAPLITAIAQGKRFLFRSAASLLTAFAALGPQPIMADEIHKVRRSPKPGLVIVGSHVKKTTTQLKELLTLPEVVGVELMVGQCQTPAGRMELQSQLPRQIQQIRELGKTPVLFTSRQMLEPTGDHDSFSIQANISRLLLATLAQLPSDLGFILSKGGNTSNTLLSQGLNLASIQLLGQIIPGCCVVQTQADHPQFPSLPVVLFPGNVGDRHSLVTAFKRLSGPTQSSISHLHKPTS